MAKTTTDSRTDLKEYVSNIVSDIRGKLKDPSNYHKGENKVERRRPTFTREENE